MADPMAELIEDIISSMTLEVALLYTDMMALELMLAKLTVKTELRLVVSAETVAVGVSVATEVVMVVVWVAELSSYMVMVETAGMARAPCWAVMPKMARRMESVFEFILKGMSLIEAN